MYKRHLCPRFGFRRFRNNVLQLGISDKKGNVLLYMKHFLAYGSLNTDASTYAVHCIACGRTRSAEPICDGCTKRHQFGVAGIIRRLDPVLPHKFSPSDVELEAIYTEAGRLVEVSHVKG